MADKPFDIILRDRVENAMGGLTLAEAQAFRVTDGQTKIAAAVFRDLASDAQKQIVEFLDPHIKNSHKAWKDLTLTRATALQTPKAIEDAYKQSIMAYDMKAMRERGAEEARRREEARLVEEDRRLREAEQLEKEGRAEEAKAVIDRPIITPAIKPQEDPTENVQSYRDNWTAEVFDLAALANHCLTNNQLGLLLPNQQALNQMAKALKSMATIPGVRVKNEPIAIKR